MRIRAYRPDDLPFLWDMLYEAIYTPPGAPRPERSIVRHPDGAKYLTNWGRAGDRAVIAVGGGGRRLGAAWMRVWTEGDAGYGFVDEQTPELSVAIVADQRGRGLGGLLLAALEDAAKRAGYDSLSLSVDPGNIPAWRLYGRQGYEVVDQQSGGSCLLLKRWSTWRGTEPPGQNPKSSSATRCPSTEERNPGVR